jgi:transposase-like protein
MEKYNEDFKLAIVKEYLEGNSGTKAIATEVWCEPCIHQSLGYVLSP